MTLTLVTAAAALPVSFEEVAAHCRVDEPTETDEAMLDTYMRAAVGWAFGPDGWTGRSLVDEVYDQSFDSWWNSAPGAARVSEGGGRCLPLKRAKARSVTSVSYVDPAGATQVLAADQYRLIERHGLGIIVPAHDITWPSIRDTEDAVTVRYTAGYGADWNSVPQDLRVRLMQLTAWLWENRTMAVPAHDLQAFRKYQVSWSV